MSAGVDTSRVAVDVADVSVGERLTLVLVALSAGALVVIESRDAWFNTDFWGLLLRDDGTRASLLDPHAGHLVVTHRLAARLVAALGAPATYGAAEALVRVAAWTLVATTVWFVVRRRGADPRWAVAAFALVLVHPSSAYVQPWIAGNAVLLASGVGAAAVLTLCSAREVRCRVLLGVLLLLCVVSGSSGLFALAAITVVAAARRATRPFVWSAVPAAAVVIAWRAVSDVGAAGAARLDADRLRYIITDSVLIAREGLSRLVGVGPVVGAVLLVGLLVALVVLAVRRDLAAVDVALLLWLALYLAAVLLVRGAPGSGAFQAVRYGLPVTLVALVVFVPRLPWPRRTSAGVAVAVLVGVVAVRGAITLVSADEGLRWYVERGASSREVVEAAAALVADGEPTVERGVIDDPRAGMLTTDAVKALVAAGWTPDLPDVPEAERHARGDLRVRVSGRATRDPERVCVPLPTGSQLPIGTDVEIVLSGSGAAVLTDDAYGGGVQRLPLVRGRVWGVHVVPETDATFQQPERGTAELCR